MSCWSPVERSKICKLWKWPPTFGTFPNPYLTGSLMHWQWFFVLNILPPYFPVLQLCLLLFILNKFVEPGLKLKVVSNFCFNRTSWGWRYSATKIISFIESSVGHWYSRLSKQDHIHMDSVQLWDYIWMQFMTIQLEVLAFVMFEQTYFPCKITSLFIFKFLCLSIWSLTVRLQMQRLSRCLQPILFLLFILFLLITRHIVSKVTFYQ